MNRSDVSGPYEINPPPATTELNEWTTGKRYRAASSTIKSRYAVVVDVVREHYPAIRFTNECTNGVSNTRCVTHGERDRNYVSGFCNLLNERPVELCATVIRVEKQSHPCKARHHLFKKLHQLASYRNLVKRKPGKVAAGCARLFTMPRPTGSLVAIKTTGISLVLCRTSFKTRTE